VFIERPKHRDSRKPLLCRWELTDPEEMHPSLSAPPWSKIHCLKEGQMQKASAPEESPKYLLGSDCTDPNKRYAVPGGVESHCKRKVGPATLGEYSRIEKATPPGPRLTGLPETKTGPTWNLLSTTEGRKEVPSWKEKGPWCKCQGGH
jgi:hypothetical protein